MSNGQAVRAKSAPPPDPLIGRVIADRYKVTSLIAKGGMGRVYRAEQTPLGRLCAIKVLNPNYNGDADPEFHRRFFREASITSQITHPHCVTIFDYGKTEDDILYMVMEHLEGQTLHQALREGGVMHEMRAGRIASQICRALREAHRLGVIHRDLKPANIFLTRPTKQPRDANGSIPPPSEEDEDFVKVLDFGLVKHLAERPEEQLTQTGLFMGSPKYMAPEQIQGGHVDERTDIYSLGIIMYEMLAGKVPFERATSVNILMAHVGEPPPPMRVVNPNLICSPAFEEIIMCCISKDPNQRFASMDQVLHAIRRVHGGSLTGQIVAQASGQYTPPAHTMPLPDHREGAPRDIPSRGLPDHREGAPRDIPSRGLPASVPMMPVVGSGAFTPSIGSGAFTPMGVSRVDGSHSLMASLEKPKSRSKLWVLLGVFVAAIVGGGMGMAAFHWTSRPVVVDAPPPAAPPPPTSLPPKAADPPPTPVSKVFELTTDPPGASVREDGKEICAATPCSLSFKGDESKPHKLTILRANYRPETKTVKASDPPLSVKLTHAAAARPQAPAPKPESTTPNGFKDQPY